MADSTIANLTDGATADATDRIPVERSPFGAGTNRYVTPVYFKTYLGLANFTFAGPTVPRVYTFPDQAATILFSGGALGTPASGTGTNLTGTASGLTAGNVTTNANLTGDVTSVGNAATIAADAVTYAKMQNIAASRLLGRATASIGDTEEITLGTNLSFTGTTLNAGSESASNNVLRFERFY